MNIFIISPAADTAGQGARIARAFEKYASPQWKVRAMRTTKNWLNFPRDLEFDALRGEGLYDAADVVHHQNGLHLYEKWDKGNQKRTLVHHHGTRLRSHPHEVVAEAASVGAFQVVSTVDLLADCPVAHWLPGPCEFDVIAPYRQLRKHERKVIRIGHSPTNRIAKNTSAILRGLNLLSQRVGIEVDLIEQVEWSACLSRKGLCDIYIDQLTNGYGNNSVEAMAMGIPIVSGWADPTDRELFIQAVGVEPPFVEATPENLAEKLEPLVRSKVLREEWGYRGNGFAKVFHSEERVVAQLQRIYQSILPSSGKVELFIPERSRSNAI